VKIFRSNPTAEPPLCDLSWVGSKPDAHARYTEARNRGPVCFDAGQNAWIVLGYDAAVACLKDVERLSNDPVAEFDPFVVGSDPPDHTKYRRILQDSMRAFDRAAVVEFANSWLDGFYARLAPGEIFDAVNDLGCPLPERFGGHMLGLNDAETEWLISLRPANRTQLLESWPGVTEFFEQIVATKGEHQCPGVLGALLSRASANPLTNGELVGLLRLLWFAGTSTSTNFLPSLLLLMLRHPDVVQEMRTNPALIPAFVSEALRLEGSIVFVHRRARSSFDLGGQEIRANDSLRICLLAANNDPTVFPEPEKIDLNRPVSRQIAFGVGIHHCLGGYIARALAETMVSRTLQHSTRLAAAESLDALSYEEGNMRGLKRLYLTVS
jgi:cytochrome P450